MAGVSDTGEVFEEFLPTRLREDLQHFGLKGKRQDACLVELSAAGGPEVNAIGAAILLMRFASDQSQRRHPFQQRGDGVGIAAHLVAEFALGKAARLAFRDGAQDGELIGCDSGMGDPAAEGLVEIEPGAAQEQRETASFRRIDRRFRGGTGAARLAGDRGGHEINADYTCK